MRRVCWPITNWCAEASLQQPLGERLRVEQGEEVLVVALQESLRVAHAHVEWLAVARARAEVAVRAEVRPVAVDVEFHPGGAAELQHRLREHVDVHVTGREVHDGTVGARADPAAVRVHLVAEVGAPVLHL